MTFLQNCWYVAAHAHEVPPGALFQRRILDRSVVLFRDKAGVGQALADRCPHRFAPLRLGKIRDGNIECGYHGLQFDGSGQCVHNPHGQAIPRAARVQTYPLVERHGFLWIWPGDPAKANGDLIPHYESLSPTKWKILRGYMRIAANYLLESDNILDLSHIEFVHPGFFGSEAIRAAKTQVVQEGNTVHSRRLTNAEILPPFLDQSFDARGRRVDRWLNTRWDPPALMELDVGATLTGRPHAEGRSIPGCHFFTPESASVTHYFWTYSRDYERDNTALDEEIMKGVTFAFEHQDRPIIEAQQENVGDNDLMSLAPVMLAGDAAAVRARRVLQKLIKEEASRDLDSAELTLRAEPIAE
jgi:phenylpropionate dioxygenase-like ring-hydroxylating dioxygenase large terminal subunit